MQVIVSNAEGLFRELKIVVAAADLAARLETSLNEMKDKVQLKGFRPGKVPMGHVRKLYGKQAMAELVNTVIGESMNAALDERKEKAASQPKIDLADEKAEQILNGEADLEFALSYEIVPDFELVETSGVAVERPVYAVSEEEVTERLGEIAKNSRSYENREEGAEAQDGDRLTLGYLGKVDGVPFDGGKDERAYLTLGSGQFIPGFEEQLVGVKVGDEKVITVTFPAEYQAPDLAGKVATFDCNIIEVAKPVDPVLDDEWAKGFGIEGIDKLKDVVRSQLASQYDGQSRQKVKRQLLDQLDGLYTFELPKSLVEQELEVIWKQVVGEMAQTGKTFETEGTTEEAAKADYQKIAERRVRLGLVLSKVGDTHQVKVTEQELQQALVERARQFPGQERQVIEFFRKDANALASLQAPIFEEKVVDLILGQVAVTDKPVSREELMKDDEEDAVAA